MSLETERERGEWARQVLENPLWNEAWAEFERSVIAKWRNEPGISTEGREALWLSLRIAGKTRQHIEDVLRTGKMAEKQLKDLADG